MQTSKWFTKNKKDLSSFQFSVGILPAAEATVADEAAVRIAAPATIGEAAAAPAGRCLVGCNYGTGCEQQYCCCNSYYAEDHTYFRIHYNIILH
jgi:hypothetical protein